MRESTASSCILVALSFGNTGTYQPTESECNAAALWSTCLEGSYPDKTTGYILHAGLVLFMIV
jgi:hypothetical protein